MALTLLGLAIIILISLPLVKNLSQRHKINQEIKELEQEIAQMENKNIDLNKFVSYLESDQFLEEQARLKLNLKGQGENVAVIKNATTDNQPSLEATSTIFDLTGLNKAQPQKTVTNAQRWWKYFFK